MHRSTLWPKETYVPKISGGEEYDAWETEVSEVGGAGVKDTGWGWGWKSKRQNQSRVL